MSTVAIIISAGLLVMNIISFSLMGHDKKCARENRHRVPEKTLFLSAALFGGVGGTLGMYVFRHKTKHWYFKVFFPLLMVLQAGILIFLWNNQII